MTESLLDFTHGLQSTLANNDTVQHKGKVVKATATILFVSGLPVSIGQRCLVGRVEESPLEVEVVGFDGHHAIMFPLGETSGVKLGCEVSIKDAKSSVGLCNELQGRVLDGFGRPIDEKGELTFTRQMPLRTTAPNPLKRKRVQQTLTTGIKAIDAFLTVGIGQRMGIFAPAGVGKSTLLGMLSGAEGIDVVIVALIGERGREVREFIEDTLDEEKRARSILIVTTSDRPAMERIVAAQTATALAEGFAQSGKNVLLLIDSITRYARALREVGLAAGEYPVRQGYPPSVFSELPKLLERSGSQAEGTITAFYTVLADDENADDPISEETRSILDGNIILSRKLAEKGHFPAIDVLASISRLFPVLAKEQHANSAQHARALLSKYDEIEFLVNVGEYAQGSDPLADKAVMLHQPLLDWLTQRSDEHFRFEQSLEELQTITALDSPVDSSVSSSVNSLVSKASAP